MMKLQITRGLGVAMVIGLGAGLVLFGGCSSSGAMSSGGIPAPAATEAAQAPQAPAPAPNGPVADDANRLIARTASVTVVVDDVKAAAQSLEGLATSLKGWVTQESLSIPQDDPTSQANASIVISVPAADFNKALDQIDAIGKVTDRSIQAEDVTEQVVDVDSRITTMRASIARLQQLMSQSGSVADIAAVEAQLTQREADLESLLAQQKSLQQRVATSTISIYVITPTVQQQQDQTGFVSAMKAGWDAMTTAARFLVIVVGALIPWLILAAIIVVPIVLVRRHRRAAGLIPVKSVAPHPVANMAPLVQPMPMPVGQPVVVPPATPGHPAEGRTSTPVAAPEPVVEPTVKPEAKKK